MATVARDLMERNTLTVPAAMPLAEIQHLFVVAGIYGAPVVAPGGAVVGIISAIDLLRAADQAMDDDLDPGEPTHRDLRINALTAHQISSPEVIWISPNTPVDQVAQLMQRERIHRVLVGDNGNLEGILSTFDLLARVQA